MPVIDYDGAAAGVFTHLGAIIARINSYRALGQTTLPADLLTLVTSFGVTWLPPEGIAGQYEGFRDAVTGLRQGLAGFADRRLLDLETVTRPLGLQPGAGIEETLLALRKAMRDDSETVRACACAAGAVAYHASNEGDGRVWVTSILDGFNAPVSGGISDWSYDGKASEMMVPGETMTLECVADAGADGLPEGGEAWSWNGAPDHGPLDVRNEGSGVGPGMQTANSGYNLMQNGSLDSWSSATKASAWTNAAGTPARTTDAAAGGYAAALGSGTTLTQPVPSGTLQGRRRYFLGFLAKAAAALPGASVSLSLQGTGFAPGSQASLDGATLSSSWSHAGAFVTVPSPVPSDLRVQLEVAGGTVTVDECVLAPAVYHGGVGVAVQGGTVPWQRGDRATFSVTNDEAGKFQNFFRKWYRAQLPSVAGPPAQGMLLTLLMLMMPSQGVETISENLVA
jgi:hypothetical protein